MVVVVGRVVGRRAADATEPDEGGGDGVPVSSANAIGVTSIPAIAKVAATALLRRPMWIVFMLSPVLTTVIGRPGARERAPHCGSSRTIWLVVPTKS